ncbi:hypothetical protein E0504_14035 [Parafrankia sp. BMG5.11]|nr:hypothetical protein E0504_14035 [Parafrankia sp. BMG5.11]SQD95910.1 conserved hypothetical protein [Parafrankia sp. Ea1.12]
MAVTHLEWLCRGGRAAGRAAGPALDAAEATLGCACELWTRRSPPRWSPLRGWAAASCGRDWVPRARRSVLGGHTGGRAAVVARGATRPAAGRPAVCRPGAGRVDEGFEEAVERAGAAGVLSRPCEPAGADTCVPPAGAAPAPPVRAGPIAPTGTAVAAPCGRDGAAGPDRAGPGAVGAAGEYLGRVVPDAGPDTGPVWGRAVWTGPDRVGVDAVWAGAVRGGAVWAGTAVSYGLEGRYGLVGLGDGRTVIVGPAVGRPVVDLPVVGFGVGLEVGFAVGWAVDRGPAGA